MPAVAAIVIIAVIALIFLKKEIGRMFTGFGSMSIQGKLAQQIKQIEQETLVIPSGASETVIMTLYNEYVEVIDNLIGQCNAYANRRASSSLPISGGLEAAGRKSTANKWIAQLYQKKDEARQIRNKALSILM